MVSEAEVVQFLSIKTSIRCIFYLCCNFYLKKREGEFWRPQFALWRPKIYTWSPVGARIKKLISDPVKEVYCICPYTEENLKSKYHHLQLYNVLIWSTLSELVDLLREHKSNVHQLSQPTRTLTTSIYIFLFIYRSSCWSCCYCQVSRHKGK